MKIQLMTDTMSLIPTHRLVTKILQEKKQSN